MRSQNGLVGFAMLKGRSVLISAFHESIKKPLETIAHKAPSPPHNKETGLANLVGEDDGVSPLMKLDSMRHERRAALQGLSDLATASLQRLHKQDQSQTRAEVLLHPTPPHSPFAH